MRLSDNSRFPHPVLSYFSDDYLAGEFDVDFNINENVNTGALSLTYQTKLTDTDMEELVKGNLATVGCFVSCSDTYFNEFRPLSWPKGRIDFEPGSLLNRVVIRPVIFANEDIPNWDTGTINQEFDLPIFLAKNDLLALGDEQIFSAGQAKLADIESIFELDYSSDISDGVIEVNPDGDRIIITTSQKTFETIGLLREQSIGAPVVMGSIYLPAVMETLSAIVQDPAQYQSQRWYCPFAARCDATEVNLEDRNLSILEAAQTLLASPIKRLNKLAEMEEAE